MGNQRDARGPEARIFIRTGYLLTEFLGKFAMDGGGVNPDLLEDPAMHDGHDPAAAIAFVALPWRLYETARRPVGERAFQIVLELLETGANLVAQFGKPRGGGCLLVFKCFGQDGGNIRAVHISESFLLYTLSHPGRGKGRWCLGYPKKMTRFRGGV